MSSTFSSGTCEDAWLKARVADSDAVSEAESATTSGTKSTDFDLRHPLKVQVKNTFYHVVDPESSTLEWAKQNQAESCPPVLAEKEFRTKSELDKEKREAHDRAVCQPCAYFAYRADGCRQGNECSYCHLCDKSDIKRRKKDRARALKSAGKQAALIHEDDLVEINGDAVAAYTDVMAMHTAAMANAAMANAAMAMHAMPYGGGVPYSGMPMQPPPALSIPATPAAPPALPMVSMAPGQHTGTLLSFLEGLGLRDVNVVAGVLEETGIDTPDELMELDDELRAEVDAELKKAGACIGDRNKIKKAK